MKKFVSELSILHPHEVERIHRTSIRILEEIGLFIPNHSMLDLFETNGAKIDREKQIARFPESIVMDAVHGIKKDFRETPAYFGKHIELNKWEFILWMCSEPEVVDLERSIKRRGTTEDMLKGIALGNALPNVGLVEPHGLPDMDHVVVYCLKLKEITGFVYYKLFYLVNSALKNTKLVRQTIFKTQFIPQLSLF